MADTNAENLRSMAAVFSTQTIQALLEAWRRGEADLALLDPEVIYEDNSLPDHAGEVYGGHEGVLRAIETWSEPDEEMTNESQNVERTKRMYEHINHGDIAAALAVLDPDVEW